MFLSLIAATLLLAAADAPAVDAWLASGPEVTAADVNAGRWDGRLVRLRATVADAFVDATNADYVFLVLRAEGGGVYAYIKRDFLALPPERLVGAEVAPCGIVYAPPKSRQHRQAQRLLDIPRPQAFVVTRPAPDGFCLPDLATAEGCRPDELPALGRRAARGVVTAVWNGGRSLLLDAGGRVVRADLGLMGPPAVGDAVLVVGFPETDLQNLNLSRAVWQPLPGGRPEAVRRPPQEIALADLLRDDKGRRAINWRLHGTNVSFTATVRGFGGAESGRVLCGGAGESVAVDFGAVPEAARPGLQVGDVVRVTGVAILDIDNCLPNAAFPQARGYVIAPAGPGGVAVVARARLPLPLAAWYVLGSLLAAILGVVAWNRSLRRLASRRGAALAREEIARAEADLRTGERTRIAADLHDALAQSLTGVALEIEAATRAGGRDETARAVHLTRAGAALASCRNELRNCLWDLRSDALEEGDMNEAVRRTLLPHVQDVELAVRFNVPRRRLSDFTVHALLCIVRELAVNAIRHGGAAHVQVAGAIRGGRLYVSVRDDGRGFDPATAPGVVDGHFGLQGVRERVSGLGGTFTIVPRTKGGMRATVELAVPASDGEGANTEGVGGHDDEEPEDLDLAR